MSTAADSNHVIAEVQHVQKLYQKSKDAPVVRALRGVDLAIGRGQSIAIMGPSGSGKSTLMNVLGCLDRPTSGRYLISGKDVQTLDDAELSRIRGKYVGFVFQAFNLITQLTVLDNVQVPLFYQGVPPAKRKIIAQQAIERVGLAERAEHRPTELSGGQMQRVAIARALVNDPAMILADEPTGNLDSATGQAILEVFRELHEQGMTIVMVTHDEGIAERCQRVVRLMDGLIHEDTLKQI